MTLDFLDDVLLLNLTLEPAQRIFERFAFLNTNLCQLSHTPKPAHLAITIIPLAAKREKQEFSLGDGVLKPWACLDPQNQGHTVSRGKLSTR